jgi:hypothetical protein
MPGSFGAGDLTSYNILLSSDYGFPLVAKVSDFNLSRSLGAAVAIHNSGNPNSPGALLRCPPAQAGRRLWCTC